MAQNADALFVEQYNSRLNIAYQPQGYLLQGMLQPQGRIEGKKAYWPRYGTRNARLKQRGVAATPDNPNMDNVSADLKTWEADLYYIHEYDLSRLTVNEREAAVQGGAMALGRAIDKHAIGLMDASAPTAGNGYFDTSAGQLSPAQLMVLLGKWMGPNNIPVDGQIFGGITMLAHQMLMGDKVYANSQWVGPDLPFKSRTAGRSWNFVNWVILPDEYFPVPSANKMDLFVWHKPNVGWSDNKQATAIVDWDNNIGAWSIRQESEGAGIVIRNEAVARFRIKTDITAITISL